MKKETKTIIRILIAIILILSVTFIGKKIYRSLLHSQMKTQFMDANDDYFTPVDLVFLGSKTIIYEYSAKNVDVYHTITTHLDKFYEQILVSSCLTNKEEIHNGVKMIYRYYYRADQNPAPINSPAFLFLEVPVSNETCRLIV